MDPAQLEIMNNLLSSVTEEMGTALRRSAYSPNIKERRDFSCAVFDADGQMIAQAAHIPVHLGAMPLSVQAAIAKFEFDAGDVIILNNPFEGGTHLPDVTMISPVFFSDELIGFVANRAHHADIGGSAPGSMPLAREIYEEGLIIPPLKLVEGGRINESLLSLLLANVRTPDERRGDVSAQLAANHRGVSRMMELAARYGMGELKEYMAGLLEYAESMMRRLISKIPDGLYEFSDQLDDDGLSDEPVSIKVAVKIEGDRTEVDFTGTSPQREGSINAVYAVTVSAVYYVFRSLAGIETPGNSGSLRPLQIITPPGSVVNANPPAAVSGGNVETSQRIVDVLLGALAPAIPDKAPAASQGTMNNLSVGGYDPETGKMFAYYETIGGGMGAAQGMDGDDAIHTHMTNTMNTPIEALEFAYPIMVRAQQIRLDSGGDGKCKGGDGIRRDIEMLTDVTVTILSDRRKFAPWGLKGGKPGLVGENILIEQGKEKPLPGKVTFKAKAGDVISIRTPGGGGWGLVEDD